MKSCKTGTWHPPAYSSPSPQEDIQVYVLYRRYIFKLANVIGLAFWDSIEILGYSELVEFLIWLNV